MISSINKNIILIIVLASIYLLKSLFWIFLIPIGKGPDEIAHLSLIYDIFSNPTIPTLGSSFIYDFSSALPLKTEIINWIAQHPPLYHFLLSPLFYLKNLIPITTITYLLRILSAILSIGTLLFIYKTLKQILPTSKKQSPYPILITAIIGFLPMFSHLSTVVNADNLLIFLSSVFFYQIFTLKPTTNDNNATKSILKLTITATLALFTKLSFAPIFLLTIPFIYYKTKSPKLLALTIIPPILFISPYLLSNLHIFNTFQPELLVLPDKILQTQSHLQTSFPEITKEPVNYSFYQFLIIDNYFAVIFKNFFGVFGTLKFHLNDLQYAIYGLLIALPFLLNIKGSVNAIKARKINYNLFFSILLSIIYFCLVTYNSYSISMNRGFLSAVQGRYLFPILALFAVFWLHATTSSPKIQNLNPIFWNIILTFFIFSDLYALFFIAMPNLN